MFIPFNAVLMNESEYYKKIIVLTAWHELIKYKYTSLFCTLLNNFNLIDNVCVYYQTLYST